MLVVLPGTDYGQTHGAFWLEADGREQGLECSVDQPAHQEATTVPLTRTYCGFRPIRDSSGSTMVAESHLAITSPMRPASVCCAEGNNTATILCAVPCAAAEPQPPDRFRAACQIVERVLDQPKRIPALPTRMRCMVAAMRISGAVPAWLAGGAVVFG